MKNRQVKINYFMRVIIIIFVTEQIIFMGLVIYNKGTAIIDYLSQFFSSLF
jgi:hypothetical protein